MAPDVGGAMLSDIRRQPAVLTGLLGRAAELRAFARDHLKPGRGGRLYALGCGDGWFAARAAALAAFAGALLVGALIGAVQTLPSFELSLEGTRRAESMRALVHGAICGPQPPIERRIAASGWPS